MGPLSPPRVGVLLLDSQLRAVHFNAESASILGYPKRLQGVPSLKALLPVISGQIESPSTPAVPNGFRSGRRQYVCRAFILDTAKTAGRRAGTKSVVILERARREPQVDLFQWSERYQLTPRERETVEHLLKGLSSKEIAREMNISPSTVKSFLKLVMVKTSTSNRLGIVAKIQNPITEPFRARQDGSF